MSLPHGEDKGEEGTMNSFKDQNLKLFLIGFFLIFFFSCSEPVKVKIEIPVESAIKLSEYKEVVVTNFLIQEKTGEFSAEKEIANFIVNDLRSSFSINPLFKEIKFGKGEEIFREADFWKNILEGKNLIITGTAKISEEKRNILKESSPYTAYPERRIVPMKFFVFHIKIFLIDSSTGSIISSKNIKEEKGYEDQDTPIEKGFMDIMQKISSKYLKDLFQKKIEEERYIIH